MLHREKKDQIQRLGFSYLFMNIFCLSSQKLCGLHYCEWVGPLLGMLAPFTVFFAVESFRGYQSHL